MCSLQYPETYIRSQLRTDAQWRYQYRYLSGMFTYCVRAHRGRMETLPSLRSYIASAHDFEAPKPYQFVLLPRGVPDRVLEYACPPTAPGLQNGDPSR
jgi:hypothetical protein